MGPVLIALSMPLHDVVMTMHANSCPPNSTMWKLFVLTQSEHVFLAETRLGQCLACVELRQRASVVMTFETC